MASSLAPDRRVLVVFFNVHAPYANNSKYFLTGRKILVDNGNTTLSIDAVLPINAETTRNCVASNMNIKYDGKGLGVDSSKFPLGILFQDIRYFDENFAKLLHEVFQSSMFYCMVFPSKSNFSKMVVIIPIYGTGAVSQAYTPSPMEETDISHDEVIIVCMQTSIQTLKFPSTDMLHLNDILEDNELGHTAKYSFTQQMLLSLSQLSTTSTCSDNTSHGLRRAVLKLFYLVLLSFVWLCSYIARWRYISRISYVFRCSSKYLFVTKQLLQRFDQVCDIIRRVCDITAAASLDSDSENTSCGNKALSIMIDVILGLIVVLFLLKNHDFLFMSTWLIGQKYSIAEYLQSLLKWLMGVPGGLKLNQPLNQFLGNFYIYHVHLWTNYLYFIEAYLPSMIYVCSLSGCLGITFLMSVVCDVLSLLTIHNYCFYIYAARLYKLEIDVLHSLLRLFTGKKWNILRNRVDSLECDVDRLFIGTLLFTILLFLFPTIILYYTVFTALQLFVLTIKATIFGMVVGFNSFPFWDVLLYVINSNWLPGRSIVDVDTMETKKLTCVIGDKTVHAVQPRSALFLSLKHQCFPLTSLFGTCYTTIIEATYYNIFGANMIRKLFTGQLFGRR